jgi:hypothetical protein
VRYCSCANEPRRRVARRAAARRAAEPAHGADGRHLAARGHAVLVAPLATLDLELSRQPPHPQRTLGRR